MIKDPLLCFHKLTKTFFYVIPEGMNVVCDVCKSVVEFGDIVYLHSSYSKILPFEKRKYCSTKCVSKARCRDQDEFRSAYLASVLPENVELVGDEPTSLMDGKNISVFQAASLESEHTTDHTVHALKESCEGVRIGNYPSENIRKIPLTELDNELNKHLTAKRLVPKVLEAKIDEVQDKKV